LDLLPNIRHFSRRCCVRSLGASIAFPKITVLASAPTTRQLERLARLARRGVLVVGQEPTIIVVTGGGLAVVGAVTGQVMAA
jgi:hypothetical protein